MSGFFNQGRVDTSSFNRDKLPAGKNGGVAVYRVRVTDLADHYGAENGDRTQVNMVVSAGPSAGKTTVHMVMHNQDKDWKKARARGEMAAMVGAFKGFNRDQSGFKITNENFYNDVRTIAYNEATKKAEKFSCQADDLPLVKAGAEAFLVVEGYFKDGVRKLNKGKKSVKYELLPLSANLDISTEFESVGQNDQSDDEAPEVSDEPETPATVDALALALADGWKAHPKDPSVFFKKGEAKQYKEAALRALYTK